MSEDHDHTDGVAEKKKLQTAFVVIVDEDGSVQATSELDTSEYEVAREATYGDMRRGCSEVVADINALQSAQNVFAMLDQQARAMAEAQQNAKIVEKLRGKGIELAK